MKYEEFHCEYSIEQSRIDVNVPNHYEVIETKLRK